MDLDILGLGSLNSAEEQELMDANERMRHRIAELEHKIKTTWDEQEVDQEVFMRTANLKEELEALQKEYKQHIEDDYAGQTE